MSKARTPAQQQRYDLKQQYPDCLLLFRLGDFYELFHEDAHIAHKELAITLTAKNKKSDNPIPMAWIPHHAVDKYIPKLIGAWYKLAIAEQVGEVTPWSVVERKIVEIITPWTYIQEDTDSADILACRFWWESANQYHCAWWDYSLWTFRTKSLGSFKDCLWFIDRVAPKELIIDHAIPERDNFEKRAQQADYIVSIYDHPSEVDTYLQGVLGVDTLAWFWSWLRWWRKHAVATLFSYLQHYQNTKDLYVHSIEDESVQEHVTIDPISLKNLEVFRSSYEWTEKHALFWVINTCVTTQGKRQLKEYLLYPLRDRKAIQDRLDLVKYFATHASRDPIVKHCRWIIDIPRVISRIVYKSPSPFLVHNLMEVLKHIFWNDVFIAAIQKVGLSDEELSDLQTVKKTLSEALRSDFESDERDFIQPWFDAEVDKLRHTMSSADTTLRDYYTYLKELSQLQSLKLTYTKNQWYAITVSNKEADAFQTFFDPDSSKLDFVRTKSLKSSQRYTSSHLDTIQDNLLHAQDALHDEEYRVLKGLIDTIQDYRDQIEALSKAIAMVDIFSMISYRLSEGWSLPECLGSFDPDTDGERFAISEWRHPVVEAFLPDDEQFIPNDYHSSDETFFQLITWPNMGWKSTYLRQNALILLLAHCWFPVPAKKASFHLIDWIFARVWSGDALAQNQSTFMTEMIEMSFILRNASSDSFIVLDELWRWTSTYDGMALAEAITVYICQELRASTLFATHYHELIGLEWTLWWLINKSVGVYENANDVVFLKKIIDWWASKSYWIDVAKLAWMPEDIVDQARRILQRLDTHPDTQQEPQQQSQPQSQSGSGTNIADDADSSGSSGQDHVDNRNSMPSRNQTYNRNKTHNHTNANKQLWLDLGTIDDENKQTVDAIRKLLKTVSINEITPVEALVVLQKILWLLWK